MRLVDRGQQVLSPGLQSGGTVQRCAVLGDLSADRCRLVASTSLGAGVHVLLLTPTVWAVAQFDGGSPQPALGQVVQPAVAGGSLLDHGSSPRCTHRFTHACLCLVYAHAQPVCRRISVIPPIIGVLVRKSHASIMALHLTGGQGVVGSNPASPTGERPGIPTVPGLPYVQQPSPGAHTGAHIGQRPPLIPPNQALCTSPGGSQGRRLKGEWTHERPPPQPSGISEQLRGRSRVRV